MSTPEKTTYTLGDMASIANKVKKKLNKCSVITFTGPLGAGKTTLIKELLKQYAIQETVTSPTFTYMNVYENSQGQTFYHFDLYRIESLQEFQEAGFDEYLYEPGSFALIEWPEHIMPLLSHSVCHVAIDYHDDPGKRVISIACKE